LAIQGNITYFYVVGMTSAPHPVKVTMVQGRP